MPHLRVVSTQDNSTLPEQETIFKSNYWCKNDRFRLI